MAVAPGRADRQAKDDEFHCACDKQFLCRGLLLNLFLQFVGQAIDGSVLAEFLNLLVLAGLTDVQPHSDALKQLKDLRNFLFRKKIDLQIQPVAPVCAPRHPVLPHEHK